MNSASEVEVQATKKMISPVREPGNIFYSLLLATLSFSWFWDTFLAWIVEKNYLQFKNLNFILLRINIGTYSWKKNLSTFLRLIVVSQESFSFQRKTREKRVSSQSFFYLVDCPLEVECNHWSLQDVLLHSLSDSTCGNGDSSNGDVLNDEDFEEERLELENELQDLVEDKTYHDFIANVVNHKEWVQVVTLPKSTIHF